MTKSDRLAIAIRDAIRRGELISGVLYSAQELGERFGASRTPVREALLRLADANLVKIERNRGARVLGSDIHDVVEVGALRLLLEPAATRVATLRMGEADHARLHAALDRMRELSDEPDAMFAADRDFHDIILRASGNRRLADMVAGLRETVVLHGRTTVPAARAVAQVIAEHTAIATAIVAGDQAAAERAMRHHLATTTGLLIADDPSAGHDLAAWLEP
ncbi:GntR family transcriptional regulator [Sinosporangium siamense]|uniref:Transcriptional regulator n=1 Tax=Sinosporangium siamense TaxID=1367973 RepID=A0A919RJW3_9ACTN|nr:GntR family transcriptional regulator [Sinosporangium siamense]GII95128.1 transcriptional regulator [Sinosporangium siamense]